MMYADGRRYAGDWKAGDFHGYGVYSWPSEDSFAGEFKKGKRDGRGVYRWADGNQYAGTWQGGKKHGKGTYIHPTEVRLAKPGRMATVSYHDRFDEPE